MLLAADTTTLQDAAEAACRAALRAGLPENDARDLAQEALVRALTSARPPAGVALPAWVYGIAKNLGRDHVKSARHREISVDVVPDTAREDDLTTVLAVRRAIDELPPPLRDVVTLHELEDNSLRETADALQIPFDTAKDRLRRAREQLRARLGDERVLENERTHTRRRAAASSAAIVAGLHALLGQDAIASAATAGAGTSSASAPTAASADAARTAASASLAARAVPLWIAAVAGTVLLAGGFVAGRYTAPREPASRAPAIEIASTADGVESVAPVELAMRDEAPIAALPDTHRDRIPPASPPAARNAPTANASNAPTANASSAPTATEPTGSPEAAPIPREALLLDRARAGLRRGMHDEALVTLMAHERQYPRGVLAEERDVLIIEAYLRSGNAAVARRRIERYRADHPRGVLRARVDELAADLNRAP